MRRSSTIKSVVFVAVVTVLAFGSSVFAYDHVGHVPGGHYGYSHGHFGYSHGWPHQGSHSAHWNYPTWHNTSHWDYHPGSFRRHGFHFDYQPGHYDRHQTGHRHW